MGFRVDILTLGVAFKRWGEHNGTGPKSMTNASTQDKRVWRRLIGVNRAALERAFSELPAEPEEEKSQPSSD